MKKVKVRKSDLETIASFVCEHVIREEASCDEMEELRGECCNACWVRRWAQKMLKRAETGGAR